MFRFTKGCWFPSASVSRSRGSARRGGSGWILALAVLCVVSTSAAWAGPPVRVLVAEPGHPDFAAVGCPGGPGIDGTCRMLMKIHCPPGGPCVEGGTVGSTTHATAVYKLAVLGSDPDVQAIVAGGDATEALRWAVANRDRFNIRVVTRTEGVADAAGSCSNDPVYNSAYMAGIAVVHAAGNNGRNGIDQPSKAVIRAACGPRVIAVGFTGRGFVSRVGNSSWRCTDADPGDARDPIFIDCSSNARPGERSFGDPYVEFFTSGNAVSPEVGEGSSFAAPRITSVIANYFTQYPGATISQALDHLEDNAQNLEVSSPIAQVFDIYSQIFRTEDLNRDLSAKAHLPSSGYYYNPERPGWGLHVSTLGTDVHLIWYTYDATGKPIWYTAYGNTGGTGRLFTAIREEHKDPGRIATSNTFGCVELDFINSESFNFGWNFDGPCSLGMPRERVEKLLGTGAGIGGQWYDPNDPGWGLSVEASGGTSGDELVTLYYFDGDGFPVWASGQPAAGGPYAMMTMLSWRGFCQGCPFVKPTNTEVGTLIHSFQPSSWGLYSMGSYSMGSVTINIQGDYPWPPVGRPAITWRPVHNLFPW